MTKPQSCKNNGGCIDANYCCAPVQALVSHLAVPPGWPGAPPASAWLRSAAPRLPCPSRRCGCCGANANSTPNCPTLPHQIPCRFYTTGGHKTGLGTRIYAWFQQERGFSWPSPSHTVADIHKKLHCQAQRNSLRESITSGVSRSICFTAWKPC